MFGPGKYDELCTAAREETKAVGVVLIVIDGEHGNGFSCQTHDLTLLARCQTSSNGSPPVFGPIGSAARSDR